MGSLLLNTNSVIMCPHGGIVTHVPGTFTSFRILGRPPMLLSDTYLIQGCPFFAGQMNPCFRVVWVNGSTRMFVRGTPVLVQSSTGLCMSAGGVVQGPAIIASCQLAVMEPDEFTNIND